MGVSLLDTGIERLSSGVNIDYFGMLAPTTTNANHLLANKKRKLFFRHSQLPIIINFYSVIPFTAEILRLYGENVYPLSRVIHEESRRFLNFARSALKVFFSAYFLLRNDGSHRETKRRSCPTRMCVSARYQGHEQLKERKSSSS